MTVVFSTYQSIEVIARAQKEFLAKGIGEFDLIICDEAHRTTGVTLSNEDESAFVKVHNNDFIRAKKRLYMTATPRLYSDEVKSKAAEADAVLCSMDKIEIYGEEIYRIGFGEAVERDLLTDYKVLILTLNENDVPPAVQKMIADKEQEINTDDASKLIGTINALSKQVLGDEGLIKATDPGPMRRAVAFCQSIAVSKKITATYNTATSAYINDLPEEKREQMVSVEARHIDGTMSAPYRDELLGWLKTGSEHNECRVLTNVRCLSEGVDVPSLDAVMFLSARNSQVDVVQSVGRVMRKSPGKNYGYIIIPVVVPANVEANKALDDNERYKVVWTVLNALRAHDDRFNATVNKIELNKSRPSNILVGRPETTWIDGMPFVADPDAPYGTYKDFSEQLALQFEQLQHVVFARMVLKVGDRQYWEQWAKSVAEIAQRHEERITRLIRENDKYKHAFEKFLIGLQKNINPNINQKEAIEMLSQHLITSPVFEALFEGYSFVKNNPISKSMQKMLDLLEEQAMEKDTVELEKFYESVRKRAEGIDNAEGKQRIILELYEKYFKTALPKMVDKLGIVYTPVEVVDFIIHSVNDVLKQEFNRSISDENVHVLDPFTGTGTFITRLLQSGLIDNKDLPRKYANELHANEIVLLAYYIAAVNIENAYHDILGKTEYDAFEGICLTDTFQLGETDEKEKLFSEMFPQNSERVLRQKKAPIRVIIGNPPYSVGQKSANDNAQNQNYPKLESRIEQTYAKNSNSSSVKALYDAYIKAFRWASDRLDKENGGVISFITNSGFVDKDSLSGFRKTLQEEFTSIYVFNLRGSIRGRSGIHAKKEGQNVFDIMTGVAITLLVKNPAENKKSMNIFYRDIGDFLNRKEKINIITANKSVLNTKMNWSNIIPDSNFDWVNKSNSEFENYYPSNPEKKFDLRSKSFFVINSLGLNSNRDVWVNNFSKTSLLKNIALTIDFYNQQVADLKKRRVHDPKLKVEVFMDNNPKKISWSSSLVPHLDKGTEIRHETECIRLALYRPFVKQNLYWGEKLIHRRGQFNQLYPKGAFENKTICVSGVGNRGDFNVIITNAISDLNIVAGAQCFPLYYYEENNASQKSLFDTDENQKYVRRDAISDFILERANKQYGKNVTKEDIFYYVYGFLHSLEYRTAFANDLKKMLPRVPLVDDVRDFGAFSKAGRAMADLHINYETVPPYEGVKVLGAESGAFKVEKMRYPQKGQKDTIIYNSRIKITNIPAKAYEYVVNGKSAIDWIMERYQVTTHKESGIVNDPNDWAEEVGNPRYILDLLLSIINVSVQTVDIVEGLPKLKFE